LSAVDLFDLRVIPDFASGTVQVDGIIVSSSKKEDITSRRNNISGLMSRWLGSSEVTVEIASESQIFKVNDGEFSGNLPVDFSESFRVKVLCNQELLYQEDFCFTQTPKYLLVSDIDDTILKSDVTSKIQLVYNSLLVRYENREAIPGTAKLYQTFKTASTTCGLPFFVYLSSSPAFLSRPIKAFLDKNDFPKGLVILKKSLTSGDHENHKSGWLEQMKKRFPDLPIMLFGDSGEQDPEIYSSFLQKCPDKKRVKAIIIHEITGEEERLQQLNGFAAAAIKEGVPFLVWSSVDQLSAELKKLGFIP
jgi:phosphatidate phosphatase APP1